MSDLSGGHVDAPGARALLEDRITREALGDPALAGESPAVFLVEAPRGFGKSRLLRRLEARLRERRRLCALLDMDTEGTGPADVARRLPDIIARDTGISPEGRHPAASRLRMEIESLLAGERPDPGRLVDLAFSYPQALATDLGAPIVLLVDEIGEAMRLFHHSDQRRSIASLAERLCRSDRVRLVATGSPASRAGPLVEALQEHAGTAGRALHRLDLPPMEAGDLPTRIDVATREAIVRVTAGRPLHADRLAVAFLRCGSLPEALAREMTPPDGRIWHECRFDYHLLVQRCRGDASVRSILRFLADQEPGSLSGIARHLRIRPPTAFDYLSWMIEVGLVARVGRRYRFADPLLRLWVGLQPAMDGPDRRAVEALIRDTRESREPRSRRVARTAPALVGRSGPSAVSPAAPAAADQARNSDLLMEID